MLLLAVDTAGTTGGVLLARFEAALQSEIGVLGTSSLEPRQFSTQLMPAVAGILETAGISLSDVDAFAVVCGPGSFTGLRIGLSAIKALAEVTVKPIISVSRLAMMTTMVAGNSCEPKAEDGPVHALLDAGRGEFYHGVYRDAGRTKVEESLQSLAGITDSLHRLPGPVVAYENPVLSALNSVGITPFRLTDVTVQDALPLILDAWRRSVFADIAHLDANYLRRIEVPNIKCAAKPLEKP